MNIIDIKRFLNKYQRESFLEVSISASRLFILWLLLTIFTPSLSFATEPSKCIWLTERLAIDQKKYQRGYAGSLEETVDALHLIGHRGVHPFAIGVFELSASEKRDPHAALKQKVYDLPNQDPDTQHFFDAFQSHPEQLVFFHDEFGPVDKIIDPDGKNRRRFGEDRFFRQWHPGGTQSIGGWHGMQGGAIEFNGSYSDDLSPLSSALNPKNSKKNRDTEVHFFSAGYPSLLSYKPSPEELILAKEKRSSATWNSTIEREAWYLEHPLPIEITDLDFPKYAARMAQDDGEIKLEPAPKRNFIFVARKDGIAVMLSYWKTYTPDTIPMSLDEALKLHTTLINEGH